jgi:hypothetical protein
MPLSFTRDEASLTVFVNDKTAIAVGSICRIEHLTLRSGEMSIEVVFIAPR